VDANRVNDLKEIFGNQESTPPKPMLEGDQTKQKKPTQREVIESWVKRCFFDPSVPADFWDEGDYIDFPSVQLTDEELPSWERKKQ